MKNVLKSYDDVFDRFYAANLLLLDRNYKGTHHPILALCMICQNEVRPAPHSVFAGQRGACACTVHGFDPSKPAWMYLLHFVRTAELKIGITNRNPYKPDGTYAGRLAEHNDGSMFVLDIISAPDGYALAAAETQIRRHLRANGLNIGNTHEYWYEDEFPVDNIRTLISITTPTNQGATQ